MNVQFSLSMRRNEVYDKHSYDSENKIDHSKAGAFFADLF